MTSFSFYSTKSRQLDKFQDIINIEEVIELFVDWTGYEDRGNLETIAAKAFKLRLSKNRKSANTQISVDTIEGLKQFKDLTSKKLRMMFHSSNIPVYRGITGRGATAISKSAIGSQINEVFYNISSWSESKKVAAHFASMEEPYGFIIETKMPISQILSHWKVNVKYVPYDSDMYELYQKEEKEIISIGRDFKSTIIKKVKYNPNAFEMF